MSPPSPPRCLNADAREPGGYRPRSATRAPASCTPTRPYCLLTPAPQGRGPARPAGAQENRPATPSSASRPCATTAPSPRPGCPAPSRTSPRTRRWSSGRTCWARSPSPPRRATAATRTCAASTCGASAPATRTPTSRPCACTRSPSSSPARPRRRSRLGDLPTVWAVVGGYDDEAEAARWGGHPHHKPFSVLEPLRAHLQPPRGLGAGSRSPAAAPCPPRRCGSAAGPPAWRSSPSGPSA